MIMRDDVGLLFVGLSLVFLIAILWGHRNRESFANEANAWETIQREVEKDLSSFLLFDIATFRRNTADQKKFFAMIDGKLNDRQVIEKKATDEKNTNAKPENVDNSWDTILDNNVHQVILEISNTGINMNSPTIDETPPYFKGKINIDKPFDTRMALLDAFYKHIVTTTKKGDPPNTFLETVPLRYGIPGAKNALVSLARVYMSSPFVGLLNTKATLKTGTSIFGS